MLIAFPTAVPAVRRRPTARPDAPSPDEARLLARYLQIIRLRPYMADFYDNLIKHQIADALRAKGGA